MKGFWGRACALVIAGGAWVSLSACAHDDSTLFVLDVVKGSVSGNTCTFSPDPTQTFWSSGLLDAALRGAYDATYLVGNQMVSQADPTIPKTETAFVTISHANVRITDANGNTIRTYSTVTASTAFPATGTTPSFIPTQVTTIDEQAMTMIPGIGPGNTVRVETFVKFFGKTTGGVSVESNEFEFPVDICFGCLPDFSIQGAHCAKAVANPTVASSAPRPCRLGQDENVDCSLCLGVAVCQ